MLQRIEKLRKTRSNEVDKWISDILFTPYGEIIDEIVESAGGLERAVQEMGGRLSLVEIRRLTTYQSLIDSINAKLSPIIISLSDNIEANTAWFNSHGVLDASKMASWQISLGDFTDSEIAGLIERGVAPYEFVPSGMRDRFYATSGAIIETLSQKIANKVLLSRSATPKLTSVIQNTMGQGLMWLGNMSNIALWGAYQNGIFRVMNSYPWLDRWMWIAQLDHRTCISCVSLHGSVHDPSEELHDHPNGRCMAVPLAGGPAISLASGDLTIAGDVILTPNVASGESWFRTQPVSTQTAIMGPKAWETWKKGQVRIEDLSIAHDHPLYGTIMRRGSISEVLGK
jgi:hypothetical protein